MKLREIGHARAGDKGNTCNICVVPYNEAQYSLLKGKLADDRVRAFFSDICQSEVIRYGADAVSSLNVVLKSTLGGGVPRSLAVDKYSKPLGMALLEIDI